MVPIDPEISKQDLVIVNSPVAYYSGMHILMRYLDGRPLPRHTRVLAKNHKTVRLTRLDARTVSVRPDTSFYISPRKQRIMTVGEKVHLTGMVVEITEVTEDGFPTEAVFQFSVPLEDPSLRWTQWNSKEGLVPFRPPGIGETVTVRRK